MAPTTIEMHHARCGWRRPRQAISLTLLLAIMLVGCGQTGEDDPVALQKDVRLSERIQQVQQGGEPALLRDLTGGDWDQVHIFHEPVSREYVERAVGVPIEMGAFFSTRGHIMVFMKDGQVQRAVYTTPNNLAAGEYSARLRLQPRSVPGSTKLELVDPPS